MLNQDDKTIVLYNSCIAVTLKTYLFIPDNKPCWFILCNSLIWHCPFCTVMVQTAQCVFMQIDGNGHLMNYDI